VLFATAALTARPVPSARADGDDDRPKLVVRARPAIAIAPATVRLSAELVGGANDYEQFYCPTITWDWDDGTVSESSADCAPYQAGVSEIQRHFSVEHRFHAGNYRVLFSLKDHDKEVAATTVRIQIRPGMPD
jgi:hypothetical protein